jgi:hypothetical protein
MAKSKNTTAALAAVRAEQRALILSLAESGTLPSTSAIEQLSRLEEKIFNLERLAE